MVSQCHTKASLGRELEPVKIFWSAASQTKQFSTQEEEEDDVEIEVYVGAGNGNRVEDIRGGVVGRNPGTLLPSRAHSLQSLLSTYEL